jgi:hypothetical protein
MVYQKVEKMALLAMAEEAEHRGIKGVAVILTLLKPLDPKPKPVLLNPQFYVCGRFQRRPDLSKGPADAGTSYVAVAWSKICEMLDTGEASGSNPERLPKQGTFGYRGGKPHKIVKGVIVYIAFSGRTQDEDVHIAKEGYKAFSKAYRKLIAKPAMKTKRIRV